VTVPRLSIVIVSYRCRQLLLECLESLQGPLFPQLEVLVVDNASGDGTVDAVRQRYPTVHVIANTHNAGFPSANNQALRVVKSHAILLLNPDTVVEAGALERLMAELEKPGDRILGMDLRNPDRTPQHSTATLPSATSFILKQTGLAMVLGTRTAVPTLPSGDPIPVGSVSAAALAFTRGVMNRIGLLDESMFWAEDLDYCLRANRAGVPVLFLPGARVVHYIGQSGKGNYRRMVRAQHESRIVFARRHYGRAPANVLRGIFLVLLPVKIVTRAAQWLVSDRRTEHRERLAGYWDALRFCVSPTTVPGAAG
jgi:N-acetylglucosaminyl-diphospho-decaprenol L-rhamnosyltransferase